MEVLQGWILRKSAEISVEQSRTPYGFAAAANPQVPPDVGTRRHMRSDTPEGYDILDLPMGQVKSWRLASIGGGLIATGLAIGLFLPGILPVSIRLPALVVMLPIGIIVLVRFWPRAVTCPKCHARCSRSIHTTLRTVLLVCDHCRICWDTGDIEPVSA